MAWFSFEKLFFFFSCFSLSFIFFFLFIYSWFLFSFFFSFFSSRRSISSAQSMGSIILLQRSKTPLQKRGYRWYDTKLYLVVRLQFWRSGECGDHCHFSQIYSDPNVLKISSLKIIRIRKDYGQKSLIR